MTQPAAIAGSFADFKLVRTRSTAQIIIEIPIEAADEALRVLGGVPQSGKENPVAIARLKPGAVLIADDEADEAARVDRIMPPGWRESAAEHLLQAPEKPASGTNGDGAGKRRFEDLPHSTQAALCCKRMAFRRWLATRFPDGWESVRIGTEDDDATAVALAEASADGFIKRKLGITSKTELDKEPKASEWPLFYKTFALWLDEPAAP